MRTNEKTIVARINAITYRNTSYMGNNSYWVAFGDFIGYTAPNSSTGYSCHNYNGKVARITYHFTKSGKCVIDKICEA